MTNFYKISYERLDTIGRPNYVLLSFLHDSAVSVVIRLRAVLPRRRRYFLRRLQTISGFTLLVLIGNGSFIPNVNATWTPS
jgi:hypothetical protein